MFEPKEYYHRMLADVVFCAACGILCGCHLVEEHGSTAAVVKHDIVHTAVG